MRCNSKSCFDSGPEFRESLREWPYAPRAFRVFLSGAFESAEKQLAES